MGRYRWPAEWEPLEAVWVVPPHNAETWPGCLPDAQRQHADWRDAMAKVVTVRTTDDLGITTNDSWIRDFGPLFVYDLSTTPSTSDAKPGGGVTKPGDGHPPAMAAPSLTVHDFRFNGWGDKYETRSDDDAVASQIARRLNLPIVRHEQVLEGGALDTDGRGTLLTTTDCLLNPTRASAPGSGTGSGSGEGEEANLPTRQGVEQLLHDALGIDRVIWLSVSLPGDDTDGHVDNAARFIAPGLVAVHPAIDTAPLRAAGLEVLTLPAAGASSGGRFYDYPADRFGEGGRLPLPMSYANFLIANGSVFVPVFGVSEDDAALRLLDDAMPTHHIVPVRSEHLVVGLGSLHCLSMQQPAP